MEVFITHIDTACVLLEINGFRILTDPVLDRAGAYYHHGFGAISQKIDSPAVPIESLNNIDLVLLSHHQHKDNLDYEGKRIALKAPIVISTKAATKVLPNAKGLDEWETFSVYTEKISNLKITATPAQHRPWWLPEIFSGKVIGFIIEFDEQKNGAIYLSGDTVYFEGINQIANRYKIDLGIFHLGAVQFRYLTGWGKYTMDGHQMAQAANVLKPNMIIPIHYSGWSHFKEHKTALEKIIDHYNNLNNIVNFIPRGIRTKIQ